MRATLHVLGILLASLCMALTVSHALEWPGKRRLPREIYLAVQAIYYPGFTIGGGIGEVGSLLATLALLALLPWGTPTAWLVLLAFISLAAMHAVFWVVTQPVNRVWLKEQEMVKAGAAFFGTGQPDAEAMSRRPWTELRDRWESSHAWRAALATVAVAALATAAVLE